MSRKCLFWHKWLESGRVTEDREPWRNVVYNQSYIKNIDIVVYKCSKCNSEKALRQEVGGPCGPKTRAHLDPEHAKALMATLSK